MSDEPTTTPSEPSEETGDTRRWKFQNELESLLGSTHVYFQPPESIRMTYPAIVYHRRTTDAQYADNGTYRNMQSYDVTVISRDPDFVALLDIPAHFQYCRSDRHYAADNLNHDTFVIYY